jgi:hypothetical protein
VPWQETDRGWTIDRRLLIAGIDDGVRPSDTFVAIGSGDSGAILLDLACAPTVIAVTGDHDAARDLMISLIAQLQSRPRNQVIVASGVVPGPSGATAAEILDRLDHGTCTRDGAHAPWTFLTCAAAASAELQELRIRAAGDSRMRVLVLGAVTGSRWSLLAGADGKVIAIAPPAPAKAHTSWR